MVSLGSCVQHYAMIYDRGGMSRIGDFAEITEVEWSRDRDGISEAKIKVSGGACERHRDLIAKLSAKRHELVIYRGDDRVWEGPIFRISDTGESVEIFAKDVLAYLMATPLTKIWSNAANSPAGPTEVTTRLAGIIEYELTTARTGRAIGGTTVTVPAWESLDPPINVLEHMVVHHFPNEARTAATTAAFEMTVGEHLSSMARYSGVDYTAVGRAIHLWDTSRNIGQTRTLTEADFYGNIIVTDYGADHNQGAYVLGQGGMYGEAINPTNFDYYGPWMTIYNAYNEEDTAAPTAGELNSQAARNTSGSSPVPVEVRVPDNSSVRLSENLRITDLVPGVRVPLLATLNTRARNQDQKLDLVTVKESAEGESVMITLSPATSADSDQEE